MALWVRSQDREELTKAEHVCVYNNKIYINGYEELGYCIAGYKSKERALEVLDEIQCHLVNINDVSDRYFYVYEMPKE